MQVSRDFSHYVRAAGQGLQHIDLAVEGVHCAGCMAKIERGLSAIPDVTLARVKLTDRRVAPVVIGAGARRAARDRSAGGPQRPNRRWRCWKAVMCRAPLLITKRRAQITS